MQRINENTAYDEFTVQGLTFSMPQPFVAGPIELTEGEASALNQTLAENLRNNFAAKIRAKLDEYRKANNLAEDADVGVDVLDKEQLDTEFAAYANEYEFGVRTGGGGPRVPADPIGKEAHRIAWDRVKAALQKKNIGLNTVTKEQKASFISQVLEKYPEIKEEAQRRVEATSQIAAADLDL
jgi:hypothetical protein